jgi:hypothetical protein
MVVMFVAVVNPRAEQTPLALGGKQKLPMIVL